MGLFIYELVPENRLLTPGGLCSVIDSHGCLAVRALESHQCPLVSVPWLQLKSIYFGVVGETQWSGRHEGGWMLSHKRTGTAHEPTGFGSDASHHAYRECFPLVSRQAPLLSNDVIPIEVKPLVTYLMRCLWVNATLQPQGVIKGLKLCRLGRPRLLRVILSKQGC